MPLLSLLRLLFTLLGLAILACAAYLLWTWYDGNLIERADGTFERVREDWRLWLGLLLAAWSIGGGKLVLVPLLARKDKHPFKPHHGNGQIIHTPGGHDLYVEMSGPATAPVMVLTHGWAMDSTIWSETVDELSKSFRVVTWDLPGLGKSRGPIGLEEFASCLDAVIASTGSERVIVAGHSIGGMTIQTLARQQPALFGGRIAAVVLINTTYTNPLKTAILPRLLQALRWPVIEPQMWLTIALAPLSQLIAWHSYLNGSAHLANRFGFGKYVTRSQLEHTTWLSTKNSQAAIARGNLAMMRWDATGALAPLAVPILILAGKVDIMTKPEASEVIAASSANTRLKVIGGANHMGFLEAYETYNAEIEGFATYVVGQSAGL